jgi:signal transduction histidine kinase
MRESDMPELYGELFRRPTRTNRPSWFGFLLTVAAMVPLALMASTLIRDVADPLRLAIALVLDAAFVGLFVYCIYGASPRTMFYVLMAQTLVVAALSIVPGPSNGLLFVVYAILSAQLGMTARPRVVAVWFSALILIALATNLLAYGAAGWLSTLGSAAGYFFFVLMGALMRDAFLARERSERLAQELRAANEQLAAMSLQAQQLAVSEERNRMARELHDSLGHRLTVAVVQLEGAQRLIPSDPERAARMVGAMREQMKEALADLRRAVAALHTPLEDELPLGPALTRLVQSFQEGTALQVSLKLPDALPDLPPAHRLALYRAAQEALTNAQRHSTARHVWLELSTGGGCIALTATDDGQGFAGDAASGGAAGGFGLRGLSERAAQLGGELSLGERGSGSGASEGGAKLVFSLPLAAETQAPPEDSRDRHTSPVTGG